MGALTILTMGAMNTGGMRPLYLMLLLVAVLLLLAGCCIALLTLRNQRKGQLELVILDQMEDEQL